ncbi:MAG: 4-demethylwyosine synthase TYW1 [Candidatus Pacearchaeota archaeon]|nr:4-demethylwyosine synthase TYW1 [Candidatus Pacearchaeota archaeon]
MIPDKVKKILKKQHYEITGNHSAVQICRWTKKSLRDGGVCYKEKFYGIKSHLCCQMSPAVMWCPNKCVHCWRAIELNLGTEIENEDSPKEIIDRCILAQRKLLQGFKVDEKSEKKQLSKANQEKYIEAQEPMQFAISLSGEPTIYNQIGELIKELTRRGKTSFLVTNGLYPGKIKELRDKKQLPTQLYVSVNSSNEEDYNKFHRSSVKDAWKKLNESLEILATLEGKTRTVFRMNLVRDLNMEEKHIEEYAKMIKVASPLFVEVKGYMSVGFARERLGYERMPTNEEMKEFCDKLSQATGLKILDSHERSRAYVLGNNAEALLISPAD